MAVESSHTEHGDINIAELQDSCGVKGFKPFI